MQKAKIIFNLKPVSRHFVRNVAVSSTTVGVNEGEGRSWKEIPGPPSLPIIGQIYHFLPGQMLSDFTKLQEKLFEMYGPIVRLDAQLKKPPLIFLYDPEACAFILRSENWNPIRPGLKSLEYYRKYHNKTEEQSKQITGLMTDHDENWRKFRSTVNPVMLQTKTIRMYKSQLEEVAKDMIQRMKSNRDKDNVLTKPVDTEMNLWALESIGTVALGGRLNCLSQDLPEDSPEKNLIRCVQDMFLVSHELDFKPNLWKYFSTRKFKRAMKVYEEQENLTRHFVQKAKKELFTSKKSDDEKGILEKLLEKDEKVAVIMASDMLFAGVDTAANTMMATLYQLAKNRDKQDKLRQELTSRVEYRKYLKACLKESLRVMPVVAGNLRMTTKEYNILGYKIPKDFHVATLHQYLSIMESQFPRAKEYIPERWIEEGPLSHKNAHPFAFSPFGFGARMCIGRRIAELEMETFLEKVIQNFEVEWNGPAPEIKPGSLNYIKGPFHFKFKDV